MDKIPALEYFGGSRSVKAALTKLYDGLEKKKEKRLYTVSHPDFEKIFPRFLPRLLERKKKLGIYTCLIVPAATRNKNSPHYKSDPFRETRYLPDRFPFNCTMIVTKEQTMLLNFLDNEMHAVTIRSPALCEMFRQFFLFAWEMLGKNV